MAFSFGQSSAFGASFFASSSASSTPGLFGASSTPAFGATTSAFGASFSPASGVAPAPLFGASAPASSGAFSFGAASTPAFGAPSTSAFGAASTPSLFGATTTSAFGASSSGFSFGSQAAGSLFGAPATTSALTPFQPNQQALVPHQQQALQVQPASFLPVTTPEVARNELTSIYNAYDVNSPSYRFQTLFLNKVDNPAHRVKPANVDEHKWQQAMKEMGGPNNADRLWPVLALGFRDLVARAAVQSQAVAENKSRLAELRNLAHMMNRRHGEVVRERTTRMQDKHRELIHQLLHMWRLLDALEARRGINSQLGCQSEESQEAALRRQLDALAAQLAVTAPGGICQRLDDVKAAARLRIAGGGAMDVDGMPKLDQESVEKLFGLLQEHVSAVKHLQQVLHADQLDVKIMKAAQGLESNNLSLTMTPASG